MRWMFWRRDLSEAERSCCGCAGAGWFAMNGEDVGRGDTVTG